MKVTHFINFTFNLQLLFNINSLSQNSDCFRIHRYYKIPGFII